MLDSSSMRPVVAAAVCALLGMLALPDSAQAGWKPRERTDLKQTARQEYARRADLLQARLVPGAAARPRRDAVPEPVDATRAARAPMTATGAAPGQAGYIHYFMLRLPDGTAEMQVGIELADQRIAWSSPATGIAISPFMESGTLTGRGGEYGVQHLFGIRPFPDDQAMAALASALPSRVMPWIEDGVQHCDVDPPPRGEACVSCLGFVLRILFPGPFPTYPVLPADFRQARGGDRYTTEDLLVYLAGLHTLGTREARVVRINELEMPQPLREELLRVVSAEPQVQEPEVRPAARARAVRSNGKGAAAKAGQRPRRL